MIGQMLDRYRIEAKLGEGGMGVVYKARDTHLDRLVAIKVLPPDKVSDPERKQRFAHEARAASALNHRHIITVHDIRADAGVDFIVMEHATGRTLDQIIRSKSLGVAQSLRYGAQIADALACAHEAGILHRDLKPSNVIVTDDDHVKVLDFGLAKLFDRDDGAPEMHTRTASITAAGMVVGTAAYMSPEQAQGRKVDARSDIFSLGTLLFEMMTGRRPFVGDSQIAVLAKILNEDPPAPSTVAAIPPEVERAILRCLRKDPARRYQTMADLKVVLEDLAADVESGPVAQPASVRRPSSWRWAWSGLIPIALIAAYFAWPLLQRPASPSPAMQAIPLTSVPGVKRFPSFSPDGNHVTFTWTGPNQDNQDVYVQQVEAGTELRLTTDDAPDYAPVWSPDGRSIAFLRQTADPQLHEIRLIPPLGGAERKLTEIRSRGFLRPVTMAWCPDSSCLVVTDSQGRDRNDSLSIVVIETGEKRQLTTLPPEYLADSDPAISPDGRWLAFRREVAPFSGRLYVVPLAPDLSVSGEPRPLTSVMLTAYGPKWISNNEIVFSAKGALWRMSTSQGSTPARLPFVGEDGLMPAVSRPQPDGTSRLAYARSYADTNIWRIDLAARGAVASSPPVVAVASTRRDNLVHLSPDGRRVTFVSDRSGDSEIWAADISGSNAVQLTSLTANPGFPRWAPDGRTVAFHSNAEEHPAGEIYVVPADGGKPRNLTMHVATDTFPSFSRDGLTIYFTSTRSGTPFIWKMPAAGGDAVRVSPTNGMLGVESIDGESLFYVETATTNAPGPLWRLPLKGGEAIKVADNLLANSFEVIDGGIYYFDRIASDTRLRYFDLTTRVATTVAEKLGNVSPCLGVSRDGRTILFARADSTIEDLMLVEQFR